jgi:hypothetical protein
MGGRMKLEVCVKSSDIFWYTPNQLRWHTVVNGRWLHGLYKKYGSHWKGKTKYYHHFMSSITLSASIANLVVSIMFPVSAYCDAAVEKWTIITCVVFSRVLYKFYFRWSLT